MKHLKKHQSRFITLIVVAILSIAFQSCDPEKREHSKHLEQLAEGLVYEKNNCIPPGCADPENCDNQYCQQTIRDCHEITAQQFNEMVERFTTPKLTGKSFEASAISGDLNASACESQIVKLEADTSIKLNNNEITFAIAQGIIINYSIPLFKGVLQLEPHEFYFYKAIKIKNGQPQPDIVFTAVNASGEVLYYGDLSDLFP